MCCPGGRSLTVSYRLPSYFGGLGLIFSRRPPCRKQAVGHGGKRAGMAVRSELASVSNMPAPLTRSVHLLGLQALYL